MAEDSVVVTYPWWEFRGGGELEQRHREALADELRRELKEGHQLFRAAIEIIASSSTATTC